MMRGTCLDPFYLLGKERLWLVDGLRKAWHNIRSSRVSLVTGHLSSVRFLRIFCSCGSYRLLLMTLLFVYICIYMLKFGIGREQVSALINGTAITHELVWNIFAFYTSV
jgi:hypothetical protein